jgi:hypothetical protein
MIINLRPYLSASLPQNGNITIMAIVCAAKVTPAQKDTPSFTPSSIINKGKNGIVWFKPQAAKNTVNDNTRRLRR